MRIYPLSKNKIIGIVRVMLLILFLSAHTGAFAQIANPTLNKTLASLQNYAIANPTEKVHLHLDRPWYNQGDTIWFKAYTVSGELHKPSTISNVLYAELINAGDSLVQRLILRMDKGVARGDFILPDGIGCGVYRIRAYTNWMRNDSAYFYDQKIVVGCTVPQQASVAKKVKHANIVPVAPPREYDIQFFPESGVLVNGLRSKVAIKTVDDNGMGTDVSGIITDESGTEVSEFATQHAGMGVFVLTPQPGKSYKANVTFANGTTRQVGLPVVKESGCTLTVNNTGDSVYLKIAQNTVLNNSKGDSSFYVIAQSGGQYYYVAASSLSKPVFTAQIPCNRFPSGIVQFTLFSQSGEPLNQRAIFIQNKNQLPLDAIADKTSYQQNDSVTIAIGSQYKSESATTGSYSIAVTNETEIPVDEPAEATIFTDLLLTGDLKGYVEKPNYYFINPDEKTRADLDLLMLTQGYSRFNWQKILAPASAPVFKPETELNLSGIVKTPSNKPVAGGMIRLTSIKDYFSADTLTGVDGSFTFKDLGVNDTTKVILNARKLNGGDNVKIIIHQPSYAKVNSEVAPSVIYANSLSGQVTKAIVQSNLDAIHLHAIQLQEVKVHAKKYNETLEDKRKLLNNLNGMGNADQVLKGNKLIGCATITDCLVGKLMGVSFFNGIPVNVRNGATMAVFIDGVQVSPNDLQNINAEDVYDVEVLTSISYLSIYGLNAPKGAIMVNLRRGVNEDLTKYPVDGLISYAFTGYHKIREFYTPKYIVKQPQQLPKQLKTVFWDPDVITDAEGSATIKYFNTGNKGTYRVVIEGIDGDGNLSRKVFRYEVE